MFFLKQTFLSKTFMGKFGYFFIISESIFIWWLKKSDKSEFLLCICSRSNKNWQVCEPFAGNWRVRSNPSNPSWRHHCLVSFHFLLLFDFWLVVKCCQFFSIVIYVGFLSKKSHKSKLGGKHYMHCLCEVLLRYLWLRFRSRCQRFLAVFILFLIKKTKQK